MEKYIISKENYKKLFNNNVITKQQYSTAISTATPVLNNVLKCKSLKYTDLENA